ncbi:MAG: tocopherol cyclase family protein [Firmicutes bacterium]|nr:tocopherol cyclase family protein [Bacillota bacterium]
MKIIRNPDLFHGYDTKRNFFEGWYYKLVDSAQENVFAFIPGLSLGKNNSDTNGHSFIHLIDGSTAYAHYQKFSVDSFQAERDTFQINVADNYFSLNEISFDVRNPAFTVQGKLSFRNILKWPDNIINPGSMGFYNYIPNMQCYSQVCAMDLELSGTLNVNGKNIDFSGGRGYIEKNWGKAFPYSWIWIQSNHFSKSRSSISCSLAHIPFLFSSFKGFLIGLYVEDHFYSFTTINRSKIKILQKTDKDIYLLVENSKYMLKIETSTQPEKFILLNGPNNGEMKPLVQENLCGQVSIELISKRDNKIIFADEGRSAGIEYGGEQMMVLDGAL